MAYNDERLLAALEGYAAMRRRLNRHISEGIPGIPPLGGRDILLTISRTERPNVTSLSAQINMTRGGVSKGIRKLMNAGLIASYQSPGNRKEIYYRLTEAGKLACAAVESSKRAVMARERALIEAINPHDKVLIAAFLEEFTAHLLDADPEGGDAR